MWDETSINDTGNAVNAADEPRAVGTVLTSIGRELTELAATAEHMQDTLSPMLSQALMTNPDAIIGLQELDRLTQTLHALSAVALRLAGATDGEWKIDLEPVLAAIPLAGLANSLKEK